MCVTLSQACENLPHDPPCSLPLYYNNNEQEIKFDCVKPLRLCDCFLWQLSDPD